jgi:hypothetical protein
MTKNMRIVNDDCSGAAEEFGVRTTAMTVVVFLVGKGDWFERKCLFLHHVYQVLLPQQNS